MPDTDGWRCWCIRLRFRAGRLLLFVMEVGHLVLPFLLLRFVVLSVAIIRVHIYDAIPTLVEMTYSTVRCLFTLMFESVYTVRLTSETYCSDLPTTLFSTFCIPLFISTAGTCFMVSRVLLPMCFSSLLPTSLLFPTLPSFGEMEERCTVPFYSALKVTGLVDHG